MLALTLAAIFALTLGLIMGLSLAQILFVILKLPGPMAGTIMGTEVLYTCTKYLQHTNLLSYHDLQVTLLIMTAVKTQSIEHCMT